MNTLETQSIAVIQAQQQAINLQIEQVKKEIEQVRDEIQRVREDSKDRDDKAHVLVHDVNERLNTLSGSMQRIEDISSICNRIASELSIMSEKIEPLAVVRSTVSLHSKVFGFVGVGVGGALITAFMMIVLK